MSELNKEQIKKALECCSSKGSPNCAACPIEEGKGCAVRLYREALSVINTQEIEYNELFEICDNYRRELGEVRADIVRKIREQLHEELRMYDSRNRVTKSVFLTKFDQITKEILKEN